MSGRRCLRQRISRSLASAPGDLRPQMAHTECDGSCAGTDEQHFDAGAKKRAVGEEGSRCANEEQHYPGQSAGECEARYLERRKEVGQKRNEPRYDEAAEGRRAVACRFAQGRAIVGFRSLGQDVACGHRDSVGKKAGKTEDQNGAARKGGADNARNDGKRGDDAIVGAVDQFRKVPADHGRGDGFGTVAPHACFGSSLAGRSWPEIAVPIKASSRAVASITSLISRWSCQFGA